MISFIEINGRKLQVCSQLLQGILEWERNPEDLKLIPLTFTVS